MNEQYTQKPRKSSSALQCATVGNQPATTGRKLRYFNICGDNVFDVCDFFSADSLKCA